MPLPALVGAPLTAAVFVLAMITHEGARYAGPAWVAVGLVLFVATRWRERLGVMQDVDPRSALPVGASFRRILVPMKLGDIGEEMVATAVALAKESGARIEAITVVRVPRERALDAELPPDVAERAAASIAEAHALGEENDVVVHADAVRARSIGHAIVDEAGRAERGPDRPRLVRTLAAAVALLLSDGRPRAPARAVRGARRRVPRGRLRRVTSAS